MHNMALYKWNELRMEGCGSCPSGNFKLNLVGQSLFVIFRFLFSFLKFFEFKKQKFKHYFGFIPRKFVGIECTNFEIIEKSTDA